MKRASEVLQAGGRDRVRQFVEELLQHGAGLCAEHAAEFYREHEPEFITALTMAAGQEFNRIVAESN